MTDPTENYLLMIDDWGLTVVSSVASHVTVTVPITLAEDRPALAAYIGWMDREPGS